MKRTDKQPRYFTATHICQYDSGGDAIVDYPPIVMAKMATERGTTKISIDFAAVPEYGAGNLLLVQTSDGWASTGYRFRGIGGSASFKAKILDANTIELRGWFTETDKTRKPEKGSWTITMTEVTTPPLRSGEDE